MIHVVVAASFFHDILHPLGYCTGSPSAISACRGYNAWSGILSDVGEITVIGLVITAMLTAWHHINCHETGCPWPGRHVFIDPDTGEHHRTCGKHHAKAKPGAHWWTHPHTLKHIHAQYHKAAGTRPPEGKDDGPKAAT